MQHNMRKVWFVTGSSRGLGREIVEAALENGDRVAATARKPETLSDLKARFGENLLSLPVDVTNAEQVEASIRTAHETFGRLDVVVNNAGYGFMGGFEEMTDEEFKGQIDTNFWGVVNVSRAALPILRGQGSGHIIQITSIGGRNANPGLSGYQAAKFAVEGFSEALAQEVKPLGIHLTIIEPGGFDTDWGGSSMAFAEPMPAYAPSVGAMKQSIISHKGSYLGDPRKAARVIVGLVGNPEPPLRLPLGSDAYFLLQLGYQRSLDELTKLEQIIKSTDREDLPPFDGVAMLRLLGHH